MALAASNFFNTWCIAFGGAKACFVKDTPAFGGDKLFNNFTAIGGTRFLWGD